MQNQKSNQENPLSLRNIVAGIIVTVVGGVILAFIIQDARFSPDRNEKLLTPTLVVTPIRTQSVLSTPMPNSTQVVNSSTVRVSIDAGVTLLIYDNLFITVKRISTFDKTVTAVIGAPGCTNQEFSEAHIGDAVIFECGEKYDIRVVSIGWRHLGFWEGSIPVVEFFVTKLGN